MVPVRDVGCSTCVFRSQKPSSSLSLSPGSSMPVITCCETIHYSTASSSAVRKWLNMPLIIWICDLFYFGSQQKCPMDISLMPPQLNRDVIVCPPWQNGMQPYVHGTFCPTFLTSCNKWNRLRGSQGMPYMQCGILYCGMITTVLRVVTLLS